MNKVSLILLPAFICFSCGTTKYSSTAKDAPKTDFITKKPIAVRQFDNFEPSFDCSSDLTYAEKVICNSNHIADLDNEIDELYRVGLRHYKNDANKTAALKKSQREWMNQMRQMTDESEIRKTYIDRVDVLQKEFDKEYILAEYGWSHRPGTGNNGSSSWFDAEESWIMIPSDEDGAYTKRHYFIEPTSRYGCIKALEEKLNSKDFEGSGDCDDFGSTCYTKTGNTVTGYGYLDQKFIVHCIPYDFWKTLKPLADGPCYTREDADGWSEEEPCPDYITEKDPDIYKSTAAYGVVKKCADYKEDSIFVCDE
ncbi:MAG: hypothetical protein LBF37_02645 [Rickettsiales bacterium]|jgi:uncharacterized protein|nr:hypothetical protein [Rickettsiales bacterium]